MNPIESTAKVFGLLICIGFIAFGQTLEVVQWIIFSIVLLTIGIPHGAIDHLLQNPHPKRNHLVRFLATYLGLIGLYTLIWYFLPLPALAAFLLMSAYHFGQSHFLNQSQSKGWAVWIYSLRGGFFLAAILLGDIQATREILSPLLEIKITETLRWGIVLGLGSLSLVAQMLSGSRPTLIQVIELIVLGPLLFFSPLLVGFVVYFGFWHALPSMMAEYRFLSRFETYSTPWKFSLQLLPFSLISMIGITLILFFGLNFLSTQQMILAFFVLISLISFPHILYMDDFIKRKVQN